jgi:uncharacterized membrane protein YeaQ/YmgE (transglycosylase-associated protein family)
MNLIWFLLIGAAVGWLARLLVKGKGFGVGSLVSSISYP